MKIKPLMIKFFPILKNWGAKDEDAITLAEELARSIPDAQTPCTSQKKSKISVLRRTAGMTKAGTPTRNYYVYLSGNENCDKQAINELMGMGLIMTSSGESDGRLVVYTLTDTGCHALGFRDLKTLEAQYNNGRWG